MHERERGAGLGKSLVRHGLRAYAERGVERVGLKVDAANPTGATELYAREGFVTDQRLEHLDGRSVTRDDHRLAAALAAAAAA